MCLRFARQKNKQHFTLSKYLKSNQPQNLGKLEVMFKFSLYILLMDNANNSVRTRMCIYVIPKMTFNIHCSICDFYFNNIIILMGLISSPSST